jgi:hypothetical protein
MALGPGALITLDQAKKHLNMSLDLHGDDAEIEDHVMAASVAMEDYTGFLQILRTVTEDHTLDGTGVVILRAAPLVEVISVVSLADDSELTVTASAVDFPNGIVRLAGTGSYRFTVVAGLPEVSPTVAMATKLTVETLWRPQRLGNITDLSDAPVSTPRGYLIPYQAAQLLGGKGSNPP